MAEPASFGLEHRNPLPKGRYWVFRIGARDIVDFDAWLSKWRKVKALGVRSTDLDPGDSDTPQTAFVLFEVFVDNVVVWDQKGLPDRATPHVTSRSDVESAPVVLEPAEQLEDALKKAGKVFTGGGQTLGLLLFVAGVAYLLSQAKGNQDHAEVYD